MKIIKAISFFSILSIFLIFNSCIKEPEFSIIPEISVEDVHFVVTPKAEDADTLFLVLNFRDGDGDLGLPPSNIIYFSNPFHENNFFLAQNGDLMPVGSITEYRDETSNDVISPIIDLPEGATGKLVTNRTRNNPEYGSLPPFVYPYDYTNYFYDSVFVKDADKEIFDPTDHHVYRTFTNYAGKFHVLLDTFYYQPNPNYQNIEVTFEVRKNNESTFEPFDWTKTNAIVSPFNQRFPVLSDQGPLEGTLTYSMAYTDFIYDFRDYIVRLKIQIKDRALHQSNTVYTGEFTISN